MEVGMTGRHSEETHFENSGGSVKRRDGGTDVGGWSWTGGVRAPVTRLRRFLG